MPEERTIAPATYVTVCAALVGMTVGTVAISFAPMPGVWHIVIGLLIGLSKATLVWLFFMHLILSTRVTWIVVSVTLFWLGILLVLTLGDYFSRGLIPYMPGH